MANPLSSSNLRCDKKSNANNEQERKIDKSGEKKQGIEYFQSIGIDAQKNVVSCLDLKGQANQEYVSRDFYKNSLILRLTEDNMLPANFDRISSNNGRPVTYNITGINPTRSNLKKLSQVCVNNDKIKLVGVFNFDIEDTSVKMYNPHSISEMAVMTKEYAIFYAEDVVIMATCKPATKNEKPIICLFGPNLHFAGLVLNACKFYQCYLSGSKFFNCALSSVTFRGCVADGSTFSHCNLKYFIFLESVSKNTTFSYCNLTSAQISKSQLDHTNFKGSILKFSNINKNTDLTGTDFTDAYMQGVTMDSITANDAKFCQACLAESQFLNSSYRNANFNKANMNDTRFLLTGVEGSCFLFVQFNECTVEMSDFQNIDFTDAIISSGKFKQVRLNNTKFSGANLTGTKFVDSYLFNCDFQNANLTNASFLDSDLRNANFSGANLTGVTWGSSDTTGANFTNAIGYNP